MPSYSRCSRSEHSAARQIHTLRTDIHIAGVACPIRAILLTTRIFGSDNITAHRARPNLIARAIHGRALAVRPRSGRTLSERRRSQADKDDQENGKSNLRLSSHAEQPALCWKTTHFAIEPVGGHLIIPFVDSAAERAGEIEQPPITDVTLRHSAKYLKKRGAVALWIWGALCLFQERAG